VSRSCHRLDGGDGIKDGPTKVIGSEPDHSLGAWATAISMKQACLELFLQVKKWRDGCVDLVMSICNDEVAKNVAPSCRVRPVCQAVADCLRADLKKQHDMGADRFRNDLLKRVLKRVVRSGMKLVGGGESNTFQPIIGNRAVWVVWPECTSERAGAGFGEIKPIISGVSVATATTLRLACQRDKSWCMQQAGEGDICHRRSNLWSTTAWDTDHGDVEMSLRDIVEQFTDGAACDRVPEFGGNLRSRLQYEPPCGHAWVGDLQVLSRDDTVVIDKQI